MVGNKIGVRICEVHAIGWTKRGRVSCIITEATLHSWNLGKDGCLVWE